jgi:hypothetical protein
MPEDVEVAVIHRPKNALGLLLFAQSEPGMNGTDSVVKFAEEVVWIIQGPVRQDVHLSGFEDAESVQAGVELVDESDLGPKILD